MITGTWKKNEASKTGKLAECERVAKNGNATCLANLKLNKDTTPEGKAAGEVALKKCNKEIAVANLNCKKENTSTGAYQMTLGFAALALTAAMF